MNFTQFLLILKARYKIIVLLFVSIVATTTIFSLILPKTYEASTSLVLNFKGVDPVTGMVLPAQLLPGYMATQIDIITSRNVAKKVVLNLKLDQSPFVQNQFQEATKGKGDLISWLADKLLNNLDVRPSKESSVIEIIFSGSDPDFVALVANGFAQAYEQTNVQLKVDPAKKASAFLGEQTSVLRQKLEAAQANLSNYQHENGITSLNGGLDFEMARLNELSSQLVLAQSQLYDSTSRQKSSNGNSNSSPDIAANPLVQNLKVEVSRAEAKLSELSERYGVSHPQYLSAKAELDKQRILLQQEIRNASGNVGATVNIYRQREAEIKASLAAQKERVLKLNLTKDELAVLQSEVVNAEHALETASQRLTQTMQDGSSSQSDISVLNPALAPTTHKGPKVFLNVLLSIFLGGIIGIAFGLFLEMMDRRLRSKDDLSILLEVPVFALINSKPQKNSTLLTALPRRLIKSF